MNYDWLYRGGRHQDAYWERFNFSFSPLEGDFIRHAVRDEVMPGARQFATVMYWDEPDRLEPSAAASGLELSLIPPAGEMSPTGLVAMFQSAQPVFLGLTLANNSARPMVVPPGLLEPAARGVRIAVRSWNGHRPSDEARIFRPVFNCCYEGPALSDSGSTLKRGGPRREQSLNLTYGVDGFTFGSPGAYEVTAELALVDARTGEEVVVRSRPLRLWVGAPHSKMEERDARDFYQDEVGLFFALDGPAALERAKKTLLEMADRRPESNLADPIQANILRVLAFNECRRYVRYSDGGYQPWSPDPEAVAAWRAKIAELVRSEAADAAFDPITLNELQQWLAKQGWTPPTDPSQQV